MTLCLVLQGHDHTYGRTNLMSGTKTRAGKAGTVYVVSISGTKMYDLGDLKVFARVAEDTQLFQIVRIQTTRYALKPTQLAARSTTPSHSANKPASPISSSIRSRRRRRACTNLRRASSRLR